MPTPPKIDSTQTNATSSNGSATANNAPPAPSSSSNYWVPPNYSGFRRIASIPGLDSMPGSEPRRYASAPDGGPPNGGLPPGIYTYGPFLVGVPEPPLAAPTNGTRANQPPPSSSSQGQNAHRDVAGKGQSGGR